MKKKNILFISLAILGIIILALILIYIYSPAKSSVRCHNTCIKEGWQDGECEWPSFMNETYWNLHVKSVEGFPYAEIENQGSCVDAFLGMQSKHCGNEGQCNCYCFNYK